MNTVRFEHWYHSAYTRSSGSIVSQIAPVHLCSGITKELASTTSATRAGAHRRSPRDHAAMGLAAVAQYQPPTARNSPKIAAPAAVVDIIAINTESPNLNLREAHRGRHSPQVTSSPNGV